MTATGAPTIRSVARQYAKSDDRRAWIELAITLPLFFAALAAGIAAVGNWPLMMLAILVAAGAGLRTYMIQHDCLHGSYFSTRRTNDIVGSLISPVALSPYRATQYIHNLHHTHVGDLDRRDAFEIMIMTRDEWDAASPGRRLFYRIYRSPVTLVLIGPFVFFAILRRMPLYGFRVGFWDMVLHNVLLLTMVLGLWVAAGWAGVGVWLGAVYFATSFGALIPYVVHNFETVRWGTKPELDFETAALKGSAVLDWGAFFDWATLNIGYHDLHHLNARIPGYKLKAAHGELEERGLLTSVRIGFLDGLRCLRWKLYDEAETRMITFREAEAKPLEAAG